MAYGDVGGAVTELVITCQTEDSGEVAIARGDAVKLTGAYTVSNGTDAEEVVFGQALAASEENGEAIPVRVRGICIFAYTGDDPVVDGSAGIVASDVSGKVKAPAEGDGVGVNVKVCAAEKVVHVLI